MSDNTDYARQPQDGLLLEGLDGTNPLGFMAALGVLRILSVSKDGVKLAWTLSSGTWRPELFGVRVPLPDLGAELHATIRNLDKSVWSIDKELPFAAARLREEAIKAATTCDRTNRLTVDTLSALGVDCFKDGKDKFRDTALRLIRSGDNNHNGLLSYAVRTIEVCTATQLQNAITAEWLYKDEKLSFRWDPVENRGYALQWGDPSDDGALTERGANCLALFAMPLFPTIPTKGQSETTGFGLKEPKQSSLTWPIWTHAVNLDTVKSMLGMSLLQRPLPPQSELACRGVIASYRCDRIMTSTYYANVTPARRVA